MKITKNTFLDLSDLGMLCVEGPNAKQFLQGQLTCNLEDISPTQTQLGAHCNPQGRIIYFFRLFYYQDRYYLHMPAAMIPIALNALKKYAVFFKVTLSDASHLFHVLGYCGDKLPHYFSDAPNNIDEITCTTDLIILKLADRYQLIGQPTQIALLREKLLLDHQEIAAVHWLQLNFEENIPAIYPETSEKFLPHDLHLPQLNAISFEKGCYTGQEIIARMQYRGKIKNHLWHFAVNTDRPLQRGADIYDSTHIAGMLVDYYKTGYNTYQLQIMATHENTLFLDANKQYPLTR